MFRSCIATGMVALIAAAAPTGRVAAAGDPTEPAPPSSDSAVATSGDPVATQDGATSSTAADDSSTGPPLDAQFQVDMILGLVPQDELEAYWAAEEEERQLAIQACMNESGFEYNLEPAVSFSDPTAEMPPLEYAEQFGFGIWTTMDPNNAISDPAAADEYEWPNEEIVAALSETEQEAWFQVQQQCWNESYTDDEDPYRNPQVQQALEDFQADVDNDPRLREAEAGWVACMEGAGHPYATQDEMWADVQADDEEWSLHNQFYESEAWDPASEDHEQWQSLVDHEIAVAVANAGCQPAVDEAREEVTRELRDDLVAVWQTIDWSLPPVTFPGEGDVFELPPEPSDTVGVLDDPVATTSPS